MQGRVTGEVVRPEGADLVMAVFVMGWSAECGFAVAPVINPLEPIRSPFVVPRGWISSAVEEYPCSRLLTLNA